MLRVREGLTYGARFLVSYGARDSGPMRVSTYVAPSDLDKAIALAVAEIDAVSGAPLDAQELAGFKAKIINGFPFKFETISDTLEQYLMLASDGIPVSWLEQYVNAIQTPDAAAVHRSLQRVDSDKMVLVAVGNEDLIPTLSKWGEVNVIDVQDFLSTGLEKIRAAGDQ